MSKWIHGKKNESFLLGVVYESAAATDHLNRGFREIHCRQSVYLPHQAAYSFLIFKLSSVFLWKKYEKWCQNLC